jgi:toxin CcdB
MMQLEVFANPLVRARRAFPYVVVLQSDVSVQGRERIVAFLAPRSQVAPLVGRLTPIVEFAGKEFIVLMPWMTNVPASELRKPVADLASFRDRIVDAIDWLFLGI